MNLLEFSTAKGGRRVQVTLQVVKGRRDITHQCHKKQRHLKHMVCHEIQALDNLLVPGHSIEVDDERREPQGEPEADDLEEA